MRIMFFVSSMHAGGAERVAATLASAWADRGDTVELVPTYTRRGSCFYPLHEGVRIKWLADHMGRLGRTLCPPLAKWLAIRRLTREFRPDVIVSFLTNVNVNVLLATHRLGIPVIVSERTNPAHSSSAGGLLRRLRSWTYPWASRVVLQSQASVAAFQQMEPGIKDLAVLPNPLPVDIPDVPEGRKDAAARRQVVAMGRLVSIKRFEALIDAFAALAADFPEWDLTIWGEGPRRPALEALIAKAGLGDRIRLPGRTDTPWEALAEADVFALVSQVEGFPNVLLEAMALGRACVTVDCPSGPREITRDGQFAELVPLGDGQALRDALARLMADPLLREVMGRRAAASVRLNYGIAEILARWDALFERAGHKHEEGRDAR
jgi:glycosyltransferase involved in cell wall biosynthesis